ncbi:MAG: alpha/beta fold hydrolase [Deltaproteobacteria bacterium]|nr:alpha/beta fold hydrolase [Deltaproteobacteria bacterium]
MWVVRSRSLRVMREMAALAHQGWLLPQTGRVHQEHGHSRHLTVFIHGYFAAGGVFNPLARHLAREHAPRQLHFTYAPVGSVARHAITLGERIEEARAGGPVVVVAHSLGGLVARYYAQILGGRVDALVALATPHHGTPRARGWPLTLARELSPGSATLESLARTRHRLRAAVTCVVAGRDVLVPPRSAVLEGARVVHVPDTGHHGLLYHPITWSAVRDALLL